MLAVGKGEALEAALLADYIHCAACRGLGGTSWADIGWEMAGSGGQEELELVYYF